MLLSFSMDKRFVPSCLAIVSVFLLLHIFGGAVVPYSFAQKSDILVNPTTIASDRPLIIGAEIKSPLSHGISDSNATTKQSNTTGSIAHFEAARQQYLIAWDHTNFSSVLSTFVKEGSAAGYGVFEPHSNIFSPGESIVLYVEPIGFQQKPVIDKNNNTLYQINLTADINISNSKGKQLSAIKNLPLVLAKSHQNNTELYLAPKLNQGKPFPPGEYKFTYIFKDGSSGKSFEIVKTVKIAQAISLGISPTSQHNGLGVLFPSLNK
jgi:hypothetical protein